MPDPCKQEANVATLQSTVAAISRTLDRMEEGQKEFIEVLKRIAEQGQRIVNLEQNAERNEKDINAIFGRVRTLETKPGREGDQVKMGIVQSFISAVIALAVAWFVKTGGH